MNSYFSDKLLRLSDEVNRERDKMEYDMEQKKKAFAHKLTSKLGDVILKDVKEQENYEPKKERFIDKLRRFFEKLV